MANQSPDLNLILQEAKHRWLRPTEILEILSNYNKFRLTPQPPVLPSAGSVFLFDRKQLRYFRKDGHRWRKKKDGKTVREAHEKLKAGSVDVLHCYYAHGEDNNNFQRRCYWMLDGKLEHIVLVHYREVKEGYKSGASHSLGDPGTQIEGPQPGSAPSFAQSVLTQTSIPERIDWNGQTSSSEFEDKDSMDNQGAAFPNQPTCQSMLPSIPLIAPEVEGFPVLSNNSPGSWFNGTKFDHITGLPLWPELCGSSRNTHAVHDQEFYVGGPSGADLITNKLIDARLDGECAIRNTVDTGDELITKVDAQAVTAAPQRVIQDHDFSLIPPLFQNNSVSQTAASSAAQFESKSKEQDANDKGSGELKKLDSFGIWMDKEIGGDFDKASDSGNYWNTLGTENDDKEVSSLSPHMQFDVDSLGPSLSQEQLFSISDYSPDWVYSGFEIKVLIVGTFLGSKKIHGETKWGCMFGELEVFAEVLTDNVIRCQAPIHASGRVPFYVTCRNRLACSEVREFEYRENPPLITCLLVNSAREEMRLQMRLAKLLYLDPLRKWLNCSIVECKGCKIRHTLYSMIKNNERNQGGAKEDCVVPNKRCMGPEENLIESLLKDNLCEWLVCKVHEGGKGPDTLDDEGQGAIHLAASLGYEWAMDLIIAASSNPNFRDAQGRTALHWASNFGREETVIALVRLGVDPTAVDDPTKVFPGGRSAADLASSQGHKGIAGYLAEAFLAKNLSALNIKQNVTDGFATVTAEKFTENAAKEAVPSNGGVDEQLSLKGSLAAVRKSAHAAALIQAIYRADSFHYRQLAKSRCDVSEVSLDLAALGSVNKVQKRSHFEEYLHSAAQKIQQKYRGWRGRKDFLKIHNRIVKIQAHVRGYQVRKQYKKVVRSVSIVEKAILRWRRKGPGLRGFQVENGNGDMIQETEKSDEYEFLKISRKQKFVGVEKALERVTSMVRHPEAREQYMRLMMKFENLKMGDEGANVLQEGGSSQ